MQGNNTLYFSVCEKKLNFLMKVKTKGIFFIDTSLNSVLLEKYYVNIEELSAKEKKCAVEVRLIRAHYERPGLYNKEAQRSVSPEEREQLWQEVAEIVCTG